MVRFFDAFSFIWDTCKNEWRENRSTKGFIQEMADNISLEKRDFACVFFIGFLITVFRREITTRLLQPLSERFNFQAKDAANFPECTFKFFVYLALYVTECFVLLSYYKDFLTDPKAPWRGWHVGMDVPWSIYWIYVTEAGFYIHGIYGTIFMDIWRDDSIMLILHHVLTISLIIFSLGLRYHNIGLVVLFLHDIADVLLEFTKIVKCFQNKDTSKKSIYNFITSLGFILFASSWIGCRIFIYPTVVLYSTGYKARKVLPDAPFYFFFNGLLWVLFFMNIWWSYFIVLLIFRIIVGKSKSIEDTRELSLSNDQFKTVEEEGILNGNIKSGEIQSNGSSFSNGVKGNYGAADEEKKVQTMVHNLSKSPRNAVHVEFNDEKLTSNEIRKRI